MLKLAKTGKKEQASLTKAILQQVGIYPIEIYSDEWIAFFIGEDSLTAGADVFN